MIDIAKNLVQGTLKAPAKLTWWPRHSKAMMRYLKFSDAFGPEIFSAAKDEIVKCAAEWESLVPPPARHNLMAEHSFYKTALVDCARSSDVTGISRIGNALYSNAREISAKLAVGIREFPEEKFVALLDDSVGAFTQTLRRLLSENASDRSERSQRIEKTTLALAVFCAEWL